MINIRLGNHHKEYDESEKLIEKINLNKGCCDSVWFSSEYGFPTIDKHKAAAEKIKETAELYRANGIRVDLQISNTIGHGEYMKTRDNSGIKAHNLELMVGHDGKVANYCFCWNGKNFRDYTKEAVKEYAKLKPDTVWIDDDLRPDNHFPVEMGCFCDDCIAKFNAAYGGSFNREELVKEIISGDRKWRKSYIEFTRNSIAEFTKLITDAVLSVSPETRMALQYALYTNSYGSDYVHVFDALNAGNRAPASRAGGGVYHDKEPERLLKKAIMLSYAHSKLPDYVEYKVPEIENTPDVVFGKSVYGTMLESDIYLAYGHTGLSYATMMRKMEYDEFFSEQLKEFSRHRNYWEKLIEVNKRTYSGCVGIISGGYLQADGTADKLRFGEIKELKGSELTMVGFAESHELNHAPVFLLMSETLDTMTDAEIEKLFDKPIITDAIAIEKLTKRGFGDKFPITVKELVSNSCVEKLPSGFNWAEPCLGREPYPPYTVSGEIKPYGMLVSGLTGEEYGVSCGVINVGNVKWGVFGYSLFEDIISGPKRDQIISVINAVSCLSAYVVTHAQVTAIPRVTSTGKTAAVSILNISVSPTKPLKVKINNPAGKKFVFTNCDSETLLTPEYDGDSAYVTIPGFIRGWDMSTVFVEE